MSYSQELFLCEVTVNRRECAKHTGGNYVV